MTVLAVVAVLGIAFIDGRKVLKGRKMKEILAYGFIVTLALALVLIEIFYYQPLVLSKVINMVFRPFSESLINFLRQR
ncbi:MAG: hypothetical protein ACM3UW_00965 [Bacillota bacterium]